MTTQEKLEQPFLERILYIGNEIPESLVEDKRDKFILLGTPQDLVSEVQALIDSAKREGAIEELEKIFDYPILQSSGGLTVGQQRLKDMLGDRIKKLKELE